MMKFLCALVGATLLAAPMTAKITVELPGSEKDLPATNVVHPEWSQNATIYEVNIRQYTPEGTFEAFSAHLPRLKDLGVDILWFMPIHPISEKNRKGTLGSYYAVKDYKGVNPEFGDVESFKKVVEEAHALGMKVIIDWVPNHTGCDNAWVEEHPDWYKKNEKGEMYGPFDWTDVYQLDYSNPEMRKGMIDALAYWLRDVGIDGFRCDVAGMVPVDFWDEAREILEYVRGKGNLFMLAEAPDPELLQNAFDMDYNWPMKDVQNAVAASQGEYTFVKPGENKVAKLPVKHVSDIVNLMAEQDKKYPANSIMMNMVTNHDLNSWEGTEYERYGKFLPAMTVLTYILPGMPLIYSGQEAAMNRALEFFEKDCITEFENLKDPDSKASKTTEMLKLLNRLKETEDELMSDGKNVETRATAYNKEGLLYIQRGYCDRNDEFAGGAPVIDAIFNFSKKTQKLPKDFLESATGIEYGEVFLFGESGVTKISERIPKTMKLKPGECLIARMYVRNAIPADLD